MVKRDRNANIKMPWTALNETRSILDWNGESIAMYKNPFIAFVQWNRSWNSRPIRLLSFIQTNKQPYENAIRN